MAVNTQTIGLSGLARAPVQHDRLQDAEAEGHRHEAKAAKSSFIERLIASGCMGTIEVAELASAMFGLPPLEVMAVTNKK